MLEFSFPDTAKYKGWVAELGSHLLSIEHGKEVRLSYNYYWAYRRSEYLEQIIINKMLANPNDLIVHAFCRKSLIAVESWQKTLIP